MEISLGEGTENDRVLEPTKTKKSSDARRKQGLEKRHAEKETPRPSCPMEKAMVKCHGREEIE